MTGTDAYHDPATVQTLARRAAKQAERLDRQVTLMEVCGTHTHAIAAAGLRRLLPERVKLISGPGCPVCVTPVDYLDRAEALAALPDVILCTFGDLMRVPSSRGSLEKCRAHGADVRVVYSTTDALAVARDNPGKRVIFLAVGFETTVPTVSAALAEAEREKLSNLLVLSGGKLIEPPLRALVGDGQLQIDGFLLPGHVSVILGSNAYDFLAAEFAVPAAIVGFSPVDVLLGVVELVEQLSSGQARISNLYARVVRPEGNPRARELVQRFFEPADTRWRGLGTIPRSGLDLGVAWAHRDATRIPVELPRPVEPSGCRCGEVLKGSITPPQCPLFANACTPDEPVGACMVSSEGTCAAWYRHDRFAGSAAP